MTDARAIDVDVQLGLKDYLRANYWVFLRRRRLPIIFVAIFGLLLPLLYVGYVMADTSGSVEWNWGVFVPGAAFLLMIISIYFNAKKHLATNKSLQGTIRYRFAEEGIEAASTLSSGSLKWELVHEAFETRHNFLLFISDRQMYTLPKRCFNEEQIALFRQLLRARLGQKASVKR